MSKHTETVQIEINGCEFDANCEFEYDAREPAKITGLPENCHPGEAPEISPTKLEVYFDKKADPVDMTDLLNFDGICEEIQEQIHEIGYE